VRSSDWSKISVLAWAGYVRTAGHVCKANLCNQSFLRRSRGSSGAAGLTGIWIGPDRYFDRVVEAGNRRINGCKLSGFELIPGQMDLGSVERSKVPCDRDPDPVGRRTISLAEDRGRASRNPGRPCQAAPHRNCPSGLSKSRPLYQPFTRESKKQLVLRLAKAMARSWFRKRRIPLISGRSSRVAEHPPMLASLHYDIESWTPGRKRQEMMGSLI